MRSVAGTSRFKSTHSTTTEVHQGGRRHTGNSTAALTSSVLQTRVQQQLPVMSTSRTWRPRPHGEVQTQGAAPRFPWVPRSGEETAKATPFVGAKTRRRTVCAIRQHTRTCARVDDAGQRRALRTNGTPLRTARLHPVHDGHARHIGSNSGGTETCERRQKNLRCYAKAGAHGAHLGDAGGDLERSWG